MDQTEISKVIINNIKEASTDILAIEVRKLQKLEEKIRDIQGSTLYRILLVEAINAVELAKNISDLEQFEKDLSELFTECVNSQFCEVIVQWYKRMKYINSLKDTEVKKACVAFEQRMMLHFFPWYSRNVPSDEMIVEAKESYSDLITEQDLIDQLKSNISSSVNCFINSEKQQHETIIAKRLSLELKQCFVKQIWLIEKFNTKWKEYGIVFLYDDLKSSDIRRCNKREHHQAKEVNCSRSVRKWE